MVFIVRASSDQSGLRRGKPSAGHFRATEGAVGLLAGAQSQGVSILFMTRRLPSRFESRSGWVARPDANIAMPTVGAKARVAMTQTAQQEIIGFVMTNAGPMGTVSLNGSRFTRLNV